MHVSFLTVLQCSPDRADGPATICYTPGFLCTGFIQLKEFSTSPHSLTLLLFVSWMVDGFNFVYVVNEHWILLNYFLE